MAQNDTIPWKAAPQFDDAVEVGDELLAGAESAPARQRKERSDKGVPRGPRSEGKPGRRRGSLKEPIGGMLVMLNLPVQMFLPTDQLDMAEIEALATSIDEQCKTSPRFRKYVEQMLGVTSGGQLLAVAGMVAARRGARHGLFGPNGQIVDTAIGQQLEAMTKQAAITPEYATVPNEAQPIAPSETQAEESNVGGIPAVGGTNIG